MSEDKNGRDDAGGEAAGSAEADDAPVGSGEEPPKITLDRYLSQRRPPVRSSISTLVGAVLMLATLVLIVIYKDRCGAAVSGLMGDLQPKQGTTPPAKVKQKNE